MYYIRINTYKYLRFICMYLQILTFCTFLIDVYFSFNPILYPIKMDFIQLSDPNSFMSFWNSKPFLHNKEKSSKTNVISKIKFIKKFFLN